MEKLLEKTRKLNKLLQGTAGSPVNFDEIAGALSSVISANVYIVSRLGKVLGYALMEGFTCEVIEEIVAETERFPE
ncbi:MAG: GTP-sensing pleiotropic transcriptional regulator CodY, partial [Clostridia bacterium]|nr:GTP-sensing pleiotropic transcriptional regulator CodY [Clostridia bacterium]